MSGSAELHKKLRDPYSISVPAGGYYLQSLSDNYMINGAHRECHPDFIATPIGDSPYGFLVCQRKINPETSLPPESMRKELITNFQPYEDYTSRTGGSRLSKFAQSFDMYNAVPNAHPRNTFLGGQPLKFEDRRIPNQPTLQGSDYYRNCTKYAGIGDEHIDYYPGMFGYQENNYYFSAPPAKFDITQGVQPYPMWKREQMRMGTINQKELTEFEKKHKFVENASTW
jgi:hypothetical protein